MNRRCSGRQLTWVQKLVTHEVVHDKCPDYPTSGTSSRRQAPVESESLSEICDPVPNAKGGVLFEEFGSVKESRGAGTRSCASTRPARWHRGGQRNQRRKRVEVRTGVRTTTPPFANADRPFDVSRWKVGRSAPGAKSCATELPNRSWDFLQMCKGARADSGRRRRNRRFLVAYLNVCFVQEASRWFTTSYWRDGSLAVTRPL